VGRVSCCPPCWPATGGPAPATRTPAQAESLTPAQALRAGATAAAATTTAPAGPGTAEPTTPRAGATPPRAGPVSGEVTTTAPATAACEAAAALPPAALTIRMSGSRPGESSFRHVAGAAEGVFLAGACLCAKTTYQPHEETAMLNKIILPAIVAVLATLLA